MTTTDDAIVATGLVKTFGATRAVDGVDLSIRRGEMVALLGPNGAGKTTTISMLLGLMAPDGGSVRVLGLSPERAAATGAIGAMLQDGGFMPGARVGEILALLASLSCSPTSVEHVARIAHIEDLLHRRVDRLSGGQLQRLRLAAALVGNPPLLVLDEPTAAMDVESRRAFWATMCDEAAHGRTVLFSTHYLEEADSFANRVVLMANGRIVADGTPASIKGRLGGRVIRCSVTSRDDDTLRALPCVVHVQRSGAHVELRTTDSDVTLRALLTRTDAHDVEVTGLGLEDAFISLTSPAQAA